ncbi:NAD(P)/FAD-dependent oxidoreductase [Aliiruegeria sabulilitoris]|uniref:NAD(P)/FAD-dependent oxidoreductase n=1 Tax=Aliiruegeria sabulilitoris TaxID=1510458 RepID=UPI00082DB738|nr:FAD-binding oxidoreductase [Aliiruegeria sabulilitoris]NDR59068.1 FAD-binding oxidoreductase [Pseudoruegeria sp. M32A2M]
MKRIYEPYGYEDGPAADSFWPRTVRRQNNWDQLDDEVRCDVAVVGGGYTGLSAALHLAETGVDVALLEAHTPGWGASGRNGGFCCLGGSALDSDTMVRKHGEAEARSYYNAERGAVELVAELLERLGIEADLHSRGETMLAHRPEAIPELKAFARKMRAFHGVTCKILPREALAEHGLNSPEFHGAITTPIGFALNPLKYATGLARAARHAGVRIFAHTPAEEMRRVGGSWEISTPSGRLRARKVIFATNGYSSDDLPRWFAGRYMPLQSNIIVTRPMSAAERAEQGWTSNQMCYDSRNLLHYFRLMPDGRMLFGMRGAMRATPEALDEVLRQTRIDFDRFFPAWREVETEHSWSGFVALSRSQTPFVGAIPGMENVFAGMCYHGNGVAMGSYAGRLLAEIVRSGRPTQPWPDLMARPPARFPLGRFRRILLRPVLYALARQDGN